MTLRALRQFIVATFAYCCLGAHIMAGSPPDDHSAQMTRGLEIFKSRVRGILVDRCVRCHGGAKTQAGLDLTDRSGALHGGESGPALIAGNARDSLLYKLIRRQREPFMPRGAQQLADAEIVDIANWIECGAPYDKPLIARTAKEPSWIERTVPNAAKQFWSFQPLRRVAPPAVKDEAWVRTPVDRFILQKLEAAGLRANPAAERRKLIRRVSLELLGLPPTPEEIEAFVNDPAPDAYERLLDQLLASPHYGERWARHWLDLARFAESHGFEHDYDRATAYPYRDFVIDALNSDLPYDTFVRWQLAGDELEPENRLALAATGFLAAGVHSTQITKREVEKQRYDELDDMASTTGTALLGLTVGCARCHDHKYDPIPQRDYYQLLATFTTTVRSEIDINVDPAGYGRAKAAFDREHAPYAEAVRAFETDLLSQRSAVLKKAWVTGSERVSWLALDGMFAKGPRWTGIAQLMTTTDKDWLRLKLAEAAHARLAPKPRLMKTLIATEGLPAVRLHTQGDDFSKTTYFLRRGDPDQKEAPASQGFLQVLMTKPEQARHWQAQPPAGWRTSYRRRALAGWITDVNQGAGNLLARVIVNRLWQHHLGRGIVATPSDFGTRGERPTHPELLDWLASELICNGWHLKPIHKLIMASATYRESVDYQEASARTDPDNRLRWRWTPRRLEAETIRDSLLAVSGTLDQTLHGPGTLDPGSRRRSIYFTVKRSRLMPMMQIFDAPEALGGVGERPTSTIAPQALFLMNNANVRGYAHALARRLATGPNSDQIRRGFLMVVGRLPGTAELDQAAAFVETQAASYSGREEKRHELALADFCQVLLCLNEFVYVD